MTKTFETSVELAKRWGITRGRIHQMIQEGKLPEAVKIGRDWLIPNRPDKRKLTSH